MVTTPAAPLSQPCDEVGMLGRAQALVEGLDQAVKVIGEERIGIEPESREDLGAKNAFRTRRQGLRPILTTDEPVDLVGIQPHDDVFEHTGPPVVFQLRPEVDCTAGVGHFDDQLRGAADVFALVAAPAAAFRADSEQNIGPRLGLGVEQH
jgi:hypothetical protein